ncbi:MAG: DUF5683 domain-containing protein [candidate division WOR-3 bacterium]|nr:DUF5683 domain-containing protein [candidate division WOR-3 bacterium]MDW8150592.1 DUF5683 domain-containing protein [candidate division WOR-3 bacterium]
MTILMFLLTDTSFYYKSPSKAIAFSAILPGGGQFYNGRKVKSYIIAFLDITSFSLFAYNTYEYKRTGFEGYYWSGISYFITFLGIKIFSMLDAYIDAKMENSTKSRNEIEKRLKL